MKLINAPIIRIFHLIINEQDRTTFVNEGKHNMMTSIENEPGTLFMLAAHDDNLGESNYVIECYQDEEYYQIHANSPQFKHYGKVAKKVITGTKMINLQPEVIKTIDIPFRIVGKQDLIAKLTKIKINEDIDFEKLISDEDQIVPAEKDQRNFNEGWILEISPRPEIESNITNKVDILDQIRLTIDILVDQGSLSYERGNIND